MGWGLRDLEFFLSIDSKLSIFWNKQETHKWTKVCWFESQQLTLCYTKLLYYIHNKYSILSHCIRYLLEFEKVILSIMSINQMGYSFATCCCSVFFILRFLRENFYKWNKLPWIYKKSFNVKINSLVILVT